MMRKKDLKTGLYDLEIIATFDNYQIYRPQIHENNGATKLMFPQEARLRNFTMHHHKQLILIYKL